MVNTPPISPPTAPPTSGISKNSEGTFAHTRLNTNIKTERKISYHAGLGVILMSCPRIFMVTPVRKFPRTSAV